MDSQRHDEDPHPRDRLPKLILAGRLTGTLDGLPVSIDASEEGILLSVEGLGSLQSLFRSRQQTQPALRLLADGQVPFSIRIAGISLPVLPRPHWLVGLFFRV